MGRHRTGPRTGWLLPVAGVLALTALIVAGVVFVLQSRPPGAGDVAGLPCDKPLRVVTAMSFAPVLDAVAASAGACTGLQVTVADGRAAVQQVAETSADVWIPDDGSWIASAGSLELAQAPTANAGSVVATSPLYMVTDDATAARLKSAGDSWSGLAQLVRDDKDVRLVVRDPAGSGDGMVGAGDAAESVWLAKDMDASALWLANAREKTRTVTGGKAALPQRAGEVGLVPEYSLLPVLNTVAGNQAIRPGADHTALLRYTWFPSLTAARDPSRAAGLNALYGTLTGPSAAALLRTANLRLPDAAQAPSGGEGPLPPPRAAPFGVLAGHHVDHVLATWYPEDRRTDLLVVVDVSGSMGTNAPGSTSSRIELVRQGTRSLTTLLPDDSRMGLWEFGSKLDGDRDWHPLVGVSAMNGSHRRALAAAVDKLEAKKTGTGLYDTILAAYTSARDSWRPGVPNQVVIFTDGHNESDDNSATAAQLSASLAKAADPKRPVLLSVVTFGSPADARAVEVATTPVQGYVESLTRADGVAAVFIHVAAGGLQH
ncbi:MAG: hypothetical protein QOE51_1409 [Actinoplanes sp.]|nr:hypothetical protein [Actinoplanes sp.]